MQICAGTYSPACGPAIHLFRWNTAEHKFILADTISGIENPSYLHWHPAGTLYAMTENKQGSQAQLFSYQIRHGKAKLLNKISYTGAGSCFIQVDKSQKHAFISNYGSGTLTVISLPQKTFPAEVVQQLHFRGQGPDPERQDKAHIHAAVLSKDERYLYCTDLGSDRIYRFIYQPEATVPLNDDGSPDLVLPPGSGPRHLTFSICGRWLYMVTELSAEIFVFDTNYWGSAPIQQISLTQTGYSGKLEGADVQVDANGKFLYATNRAEVNEVVVFKIQQNGQLEFIQRIGAAGLSPRNLLICEQENLVLVANERSNTISIFLRNIDGTLEFTKAQLGLPSPTCVKELVRPATI